jgi:carbon monoxide dehydrogenase subunit G
MRLEIAKTADLASAPEQVWDALRQPEWVAACLPDIEAFAATDTPGRYATTLVEKLGPFSVRVALSIDVSEHPETRTMVARIAGEDRGGAARVRGEVRAQVAPAESAGSVLDVTSDVEVLGRLASLGAVPIRRRGDQVFEAFIKTFQRRLEEQHA